MKKFLILIFAYIVYLSLTYSQILVLVDNTIHHCGVHVFMGEKIIAACKQKLIVSSDYKLEHLE